MEEQLSPESLLRSECLKQYRLEKDTIHGELLSMNMYVLFMRKMADFPFSVLHSHPILFGFWDVVFVSLFETSISIIYRVCFDTKKGQLTLVRFKETILKCFADAQARSEFEQQCKETSFEISRDEYASQLRSLRHERIAHFNRDRVANAQTVVPEINRVSLSNIEEIRDAVNEYFRVLSLGHEFGMLLMQYLPEYSLFGEDQGVTDIDKLLDYVAEQSPVLRMPEDQPTFWPTYRQENLANDDVRVLNEWRQKFGLPPVE